MNKSCRIEALYGALVAFLKMHIYFLCCISLFLIVGISLVQEAPIGNFYPSQE